MDDPASPEEPAPVIINARGERNSGFAIIHRNLHFPAGIEPYKAFQLLEGVGDLLFNGIMVGQCLSGERGVEINNDFGTDYINYRSFTHLVHLHGYTAYRLFLELVFGKRLDTFGVAVAKCLFRPNNNIPGIPDVLSDEVLIKAKDYMFLPDTDRDRPINRVLAVNTGRFCLSSIRCIKNVFVHAACIAQFNKISILYRHDSPDYIKSQRKQINVWNSHA